MLNMDVAKELEEIQARIEEELICPLKDAARNIVFGKGNPHAKIFFIGEAPGEKEDETGIPFVGRAGQELDTLLKTIHLTLDDVYVANILKYRPPNNRDPTAEEIISHTPYLVEQILAIKPQVIVTLGNFSTKFVLSQFNQKEMKHVEGISSLHGTVHKITLTKKDAKENAVTQEVLVIPMYHPAAMLYRPQLRKVIEEDFAQMKHVLK